MRKALQVHGTSDVAEDLSVQFHVPVRRDEENAVKLRQVVFIKTCRVFLVDEDDVPQKHYKGKEKTLDLINFRPSMNRRNFYWLIRGGPGALIPQLVVDPRFPVEVTQLVLNLACTHWRIQEGSQGRPPRPNSFIFMQAKIIG